MFAVMAVSVVQRVLHKPLHWLTEKLLDVALDDSAESMGGRFNPTNAAIPANYEARRPASGPTP
jgi:hypothetical protein